MFYNTLLLTSDKKTKNYIAVNLYYYARHVKDSYTSEYKVVKLRAKGDKLLANIRKFTGGLISYENDVLTTELLHLANELADDRGDRLSYSKQRMPRPVLVLSIIASVLWLAPFFALSFSNFFVGVFFVGGVTLTVVSILLIVVDLDNPFGGTWGINLDSWDDVIAKIKIKRRQ
jgi:hypothetical protein